jgi:hypothetical protein
MIKYLIDDQNVNADLLRKFFEMYYSHKLHKNMILLELNLKLFFLFVCLFIYLCMYVLMHVTLMLISDLNIIIFTSLSRFSLNQEIKSDNMN